MQSKAGNTNLIGTNERKHQEMLNYRMELKENEKRTLIVRSLLDFETWRSHSRYLELKSKISEGVPPLEAHHCSQDKAKEEEDSRLTISL